MADTHNWDLLLRDATLATANEDGSLSRIENGAIAIDNGLIAWVGALDDLPEHQAASDISLEGKLLTPGLIDCHTHLVYAGNRSAEFAARLAGKSYSEIAREGGGILSTVRETRATSEEELYAQSLPRLRALMEEGVTTIEIKSGYGLDLESERKMLRVAKRLSEENPVMVRKTFLGAHALPPEYKDHADGYIDFICNELLPKLTEEGLVDAVDGFCESIGFSCAQIERIFAKAQSLSQPVKLHAEQLSDQGGTQLAARFNALSADHLEFATESGIEAMAKAETVAVLLPGAFYMLRETQKPPLELLRKNDVPIALATDCNPGTSPTTSLLLMMNMGCVLFGMSPDEAFAAVTLNAARALGLGASHGTLQAGKLADLAIWNAKHPVELCGQPGYNPLHAVIKRGNPSYGEI